MLAYPCNLYICFCVVPSNACLQKKRSEENKQNNKMEEELFIFKQLFERIRATRSDSLKRAVIPTIRILVIKTLLCSATSGQTLNRVPLNLKGIL